MVDRIGRDSSRISPTSQRGASKQAKAIKATRATKVTRRRGRGRMWGEGIPAHSTPLKINRAGTINREASRA